MAWCQTREVMPLGWDASEESSEDNRAVALVGIEYDCNAEK